MQLRLCLTWAMICRRSAARGYANTSVLEHTGGVRSVDFLDNVLVSGSSDRTLRLWDAAVRAFTTPQEAKDSIF